MIIAESPNFQQSVLSLVKKKISIFYLENCSKCDCLVSSEFWHFLT